jgi:hypothetical protein
MLPNSLTLISFIRIRMDTKFNKIKFNNLIFKFKSEETDDDVSLSNALESDEDDTEPTRSQLNEKYTGNGNQDEISDLESIR